MKKFLALGLTVLLMACGIDLPLEPISLDYNGLNKIYLAAQDIRIIDKTKDAPHWPPYIGHKFRPSLTEALNAWAAARLQAVGPMGHATLVIKDATLSEQKLETEKGLTHYFERQQALKYIGRLEVSLEMQSPDGRVAITNAHASRYVTLPEDPTSEEKQKAYKAILDGMMDDLNMSLDAGMRKHMARFVLPAPVQAPAYALPMQRPYNK